MVTILPRVQNSGLGAGLLEGLSTGLEQYAHTKLNRMKQKHIKSAVFSESTFFNVYYSYRK